LRVIERALIAVEPLEYGFAIQKFLPQATAAASFHAQGRRNVGAACHSFPALGSPGGREVPGMSTSLAAQLVAAIGEDRAHTAVVVRAIYQPVGGAGNSVMPPTFPLEERERDLTKKYLIADRLVDGEVVKTVTIDQEQSQANRVEEALRDARDSGRIELPMLE